MECPKCGNILDENETSCKNCGAKVKENTLNSISKGGGRTQVPTEEEKAEVIREVQQAQQMQAQQQNNGVNPQEYMMYQQQLMANKNNNMTLMLVVGLIIIVASFGGILLFNHMKGEGTTALKSSTTTETDKMKEVNEPKSEVATDAVDIKIGRFTITMPGNYDTTLKDNMGISKDVANQIQIVYTIMSTISYDKVVNGAETFKSDLASLGFAVAEYKEEVYNGRKWFIFSGILQERSAMYAVTAVDTYATYQATIFNLGGKSREELYSELTTVVNGIKTNDNRSAVPDEGQNSGENTNPSTPSEGNTSPSTPSGYSNRTAPSGAVEA